jgi:methyl-accepting chemotaxis protein
MKLNFNYLKSIGTLTIGKRMVLGFGAIVVILLVISYVGITAALKSKNFSEVELVSVWDAADGAMESRITMLQTVWGVMEGAGAFDETSQAEAKDRIAGVADEFTETTTMLERSGLVRQEQIEFVRAQFDRMLVLGSEWVDIALQKAEQMEALDGAAVKFIEGQVRRGAPSAQIHQYWQFTMAANDYAAYADEEVEAEYNGLAKEIKARASTSASFKRAWAPVVNTADQLLATAKKETALEDEFDTIAEGLEGVFEGIEEGTNGQEGADAYGDRLLSEMQSQSRASLTQIILFAALGLAIGIPVVFLIIRSITGPINRVTSLVRDLAEGEGDLTKRVNFESKDELGVLSGLVDTFVAKTQDMVKAISTSATQVGSASTEISSTSEQLAAGAEEQQSQLSEVATTMEQMSAMILESSKNADETRQNAQTAGQTAGTGRETVTKTVSGFQTVANTVERAAGQIEELSKRSEDIGNVIQVIDEIADQTNLLALNANIEAARAGEAGRGFAVVADEVRKLAERTVSATGEISKMIESIQGDISAAVESMTEIQTQSNEGLELVSQSDSSLEEISGSVTSVVSAVEQIASAANEQSSGAEEVSKNIEGVSTVAKQSASSAQELAASSQQLNQEIQSMNELIGQFKVD